MNLTNKYPMEHYDVILDSVSKRFGNVIAVDNVSIKIKNGTFLSLLGPSGCGKTTTLRMIGGFEEPTQGQIWVGGKNKSGVPPYKRETNIVFQDYALFPHMNILNNIGFGLKMRGVRKEEIFRKVMNILETVGLPDIIYRKPNELSGGQRQRVALCRVLILEPAVLLLDEPLGALDAKIRKQMQIELKNLQRRLGRTFIAVTHDQEEAMTMSDQIAIMNEGRIEQQGNPQSIYEKPDSLFVATFLGECNLIEAEIGKINKDYVMASAHTFGELFVKSDKGLKKDNIKKHIHVMVRPEHIRIGAESQAYENRIKGMIKSSTFKGSFSEYIVKTDSSEIVVHKQGNSQFREYENVVVSWRRENCHMIL